MSGPEFSHRELLHGEQVYTRVKPKSGIAPTGNTTRSNTNKGRVHRNRQNFGPVVKISQRLGAEPAAESHEIPKRVVPH